MPSRLSDAKAPTRSSSRAPVPPRISDRFGFAPRGNFSEMPALSSRAEKRAGPTRSSRSTAGMFSDSRSACAAPTGPLNAPPNLPGGAVAVGRGKGAHQVRGPRPRAAKEQRQGRLRTARELQRDAGVVQPRRKARRADAIEQVDGGNVQRQPQRLRRADRAVERTTEVARPVAVERLRRVDQQAFRMRSEEHTSELQSLMRISYAVFCLKKKNDTNEK